MRSYVKFRAGVVGFTITFLLLMQWLTLHPHFVETYYSNGIYPFITLIISGITNQFSFSVTELFILIIIFLGLPLYIKRIRRKKRSLGIIVLNFLTLISIFVIWFYLSWGINYLRLPIKNKLALDHVNLEIDSYDSTFVDLIKITNQLNRAYFIEEIPQINEAVESSYAQVLQDLNLPTVPGPKEIKTFFLNWVLNKTTTSGFFSPLFHEVHYNDDLLIIELPFVIAHEKAHQMGYTSEMEANFLAFLVCSNSEDKLVRYSGYFSILGYFFQYVRDDKEKREYYNELLDEGVKLDFAAVRQRWRSYTGFISDVSQKSYDLYLKANRVQEGAKNYSMVVDLILCYYSRKAEEEKEKVEALNH